jgi:hypothetical protein
MLSFKPLQAGACTKPESFDIAVNCRSKIPDLNSNASSPQTYGSLTRLGSYLAAARCSEREVSKQANKHHYDTRNSCLAGIWRKNDAVYEHENIDDVGFSNHFLDVSSKMVELCLHTCLCEEVHGKKEVPLLVGITKVGAPQQAITSHRILRRKQFDSSAKENTLSRNSPSFNTVPSNLYPNTPGIHTGRARSEGEEQEFERFVRENTTVSLLQRMEELRAQELHDLRRLRRLEELEARLRQIERYRPSPTPSYNPGGARSKRDRMEIKATLNTLRGGVTTKRRRIRFKSQIKGVELTPRETAVNSRRRSTRHHLARRGFREPTKNKDLRHPRFTRIEGFSLPTNRIEGFSLPTNRIEGFPLPTNRIEGFPLPTNRSPSQSLRYSGITCLNVEIPPQHDLDIGREIPWPTVRTGHVIRFLRDDTICRMQCECGDHTNWTVVCDRTISLERNTFSGNSRVQRICAEGCRCWKPPATLPNQ